MRTAVLVTPLTHSIPRSKSADYIGVDAGCLKILQEKLPLTMGIGDFDSMDADTFRDLKERYELVLFPVRKNETDSELALDICSKKGYERIVLTGSLSGRIDHTLAHIRLLITRYPSLVLLDEKQQICCLEKGVHRIPREYRHISFFALEDSIVTLEGFAYELDKAIVTPKDIFTVSNSVTGKAGIVTLEKGRLLCIESDFK